MHADQGISTMKHHRDVPGAGTGLLCIERGDERAMSAVERNPHTAMSGRFADSRKVNIRALRVLVHISSDPVRADGHQRDRLTAAMICWLHRFDDHSTDSGNGIHPGGFMVLYTLR